MSISIGYSQTDKEKIQSLVLSLDDALVKKDSMALEKSLSPDFIGVIPSGKSMNKSEYIKHHCKPNIGLTEIHQQDAKTQIRIYDHVAIVNRTVSAKLKKPDGSVTQFDVQRMEALHKKDGKWWLITGQGTEVNLALRP